MTSPRARAGLLLGAVLCAAAFATPALAHEQGDWLVKAGVSQVRPKSDNGSALSGSVNLDVNNDVKPSISGTYMFTRNIGLDVLAAVPFRHDVYGSGAVNGQLGSSKQLPPTVSVQWHFLPDQTFQPYVGLGVNYTRFFSTKAVGPLAGNELKLTDSWGMAAQFGVDVKINERWFVNADLRYIDIDSDVKLNGNKIGKANIDPWVATIAVGYRF
jgi:outer membrane protein